MAVAVVFPGFLSAVHETVSGRAAALATTRGKFWLLPMRCRITVRRLVIADAARLALAVLTCLVGNCESRLTAAVSWLTIEHYIRHIIR